MLDTLSIILLALTVLGLSIYSANLRAQLDKAEQWVDEIIEELSKEP